MVGEWWSIADRSPGPMRTSTGWPRSAGRSAKRWVGSTGWPRSRPGAGGESDVVGRVSPALRPGRAHRGAADRGHRGPRAAAAVRLGDRRADGGAADAVPPAVDGPYGLRPGPSAGRSHDDLAGSWLTGYGRSPLGSGWSSRSRPGRWSPWPAPA